MVQALIRYNVESDLKSTSIDSGRRETCPFTLQSKLQIMRQLLACLYLWSAARIVCVLKAAYLSREHSHRRQPG